MDGDFFGAYADDSLFESNERRAAKEEAYVPLTLTPYWYKEKDAVFHDESGSTSHGLATPGVKSTREARSDAIAILTTAEHLYLERKYREVVDTLAAIARPEQLTNSQLLTCEDLRSRSACKLGEYDVALAATLRMLAKIEKPGLRYDAAMIQLSLQRPLEALDNLVIALEAEPSSMAFWVAVSAVMEHCHASCEVTPAVTRRCGSFVSLADRDRRPNTWTAQSAAVMRTNLAKRLAACPTNVLLPAELQTRIRVLSEREIEATNDADENDPSNL